MDDYPFDVPHQPGTPIDWYLERMRLSGITEGIARKCGFRLKVDDYGAFFTIPYFTMDGLQTTLVRQRNRESRMEYGPSQSGGGWKGKYTQPPKSKNQVYWPPITDQIKDFTNVSHPLIVCEGELKSICCKMHVLAQGEGHEALVVGVPGTALDDNVRNMLKLIPMQGDKDSVRRVFLAIDWNAKGQAAERAAQLELELKKLFQTLGGEVLLLRWPLAPNAGEQKLDDWLVAGGDISAAMHDSVINKTDLQTEIEEHWNYFNENYCIMHGKYIPLSNLTQKYSNIELKNMEYLHRVQTGPKTFIGPADVWSLQPKQDRNIVDGYIFVPAPLGQEPDRYIREDGLRLVNTAPKANWIAPPWGEDVPDCTPFLNLVQRLTQDGSEWFLNFLAHCAQFPTERGSHIVILKDEGGTGKSRLFETLDLVFGKYSGPIGDALSSNFNAMLEHLVIAWWSDPVIHGGFDRDLESALKNFSGDSKLAINHKGGAKYVVQGYGRLIIATNKDWIVPVSTKERRFAVFGGLVPMTPDEAGAYMKWLKDGGVDAIRLFLTQRDLTNFDIHQPAPRTEQRVEMERNSAPPLIRMLECEPFTDRDIWSTAQISREYNEQTGKRLSNDAIGKLLSNAGVIKRLVRVEGGPQRLNAIRNTAYWDGAPSTEWAENYKGRKHEG